VPQRASRKASKKTSKKTSPKTSPKTSRKASREPRGARTRAASGPLRCIAAATDFSEPARVALDRAVEIARTHEARLVLVHALTVEPQAAGGPQLFTLPPDFEERVRDASLRKLEELIERVRKQGVDARAELEPGPAAETIVATAEQHGAELIVCGTRGLTGFRHLLLGSTAEEVVRTASCPVLTIHPHDVRSLEKPGSVLLPTDFSEDAAQAAALARRLFHGTGRMRAVLLHVYHLPVPLTPLAGAYPVGSVLVSDACDVSREALQPIADELRDAGFEVETLAREGNPPTTITELASQLRVDLIVMGTRGLSGVKHVLLGSTAERVVQHAACPVLTAARGGR
jgi:nucleotide-binding universal stress UspA family protein